MMVAALAVALLAGCTVGPDGSATDELPVQVAPQVLDRRDADDDDADEGQGGESEASDPDGPIDAADDGSDPVESTTAAPDEDAAADDAATPPADAPTPSPDTSAEPTPAPQPPVAPPPAVLASGHAEATGLTWASDGTEWLEASSVVLRPDDADPAPFVVRLQPVDGPFDAATRDARCQVTLSAPLDRALVVRGEITVAVAIDTAEGSTIVRPRQRIVIDVVVEAGERLELQVANPATVSVKDADRAIGCVADLRSGSSS